MPDAGSIAPKAVRVGRVRAWAGRLGLLLFGLVVALLLGEVLIRMFANEGPIQTFRDREIGRRFTRSWEGDVYVEEAGRVVHQRFNSEGMRDQEWAAAGSFRIAVLGDSMVAALATDEDRRFTHVTSELPIPSNGWMLGNQGQSYGVPQVQNWGVSGSSPALAARLFEARVARGSPDVAVLVWFVGNDLSDDWPLLGGRRIAAADLGDDGSLSWRPFEEGTSGLSEWLARNSRLYVWQKRLLARVRGDVQDRVRPGLRALEADGDHDPVLRGAWRMAEAVLARFVASAKAARVRPMVLVLPCAEQVYDDLWERTALTDPPLGRPRQRGYPQERLEAACRGLQIPVHSVSFGAGRRLDRPADHVFLGGTGHLNDAGHALVRAQLEALLQRELEEEPRVLLEERSR